MQELYKQWPDVQLLESRISAQELITEVFDESSDQPIRIWLR
jgi:hypothetical protein